LCSYHGSLCGRYEKASDHTRYAHLPDLFRERQNRLVEGLGEKDLKPGSAQVVGIPNILSFFDYLPFWTAFLNTLGHPVLLSEGTNKTLIQRGLSCVPSETCFPIKTVYGHIRDLAAKGADVVLLPCETDHPTGNDTSRSFNCPYVQSMPYMVKAALGPEVALLAPIIGWSQKRKVVDRVLMDLSRSLGHRAKRAKKAIAAGRGAQARFDKWRHDRGKEILASLGPRDRCLVLLGKAHNIFDPGLNLHLARKLRRQGQLTIPFDMLPLKEVTLPYGYDNVVWKNTRDLLKACLLIRHDQRLFPVLLTNFGCGPDSFLMKYMETELTHKPYLVLEVDDHTGDAGLVTRIEAFLDTLDGLPSTFGEKPQPLNLVIKAKERTMDRFGPDPQLLKRLENRILYFPYVSQAFSTIVEAAFRSVGLEAQVLPEPDDETEHLGRQVTSGRECHPFICTCGDFVKLTRRSEFDPKHAAVWMANYDGACRFSQYGIGHADLFRRLGFSEVPVIAPLTSTRYDEFSGLFGLRFTQRLWQGWLAAEILERMRLHVRPYERKAGDTDRAFAAAMQGLAKVVAQPNGRPSGRGRKILAYLKHSMDVLSAVPVDRSKKRPTIGILGEFFTVLNDWANHDLIRTLEGLGVEVVSHGLTVTNFITLFSEHYYHRNCLKRGKVGAAFYYFLRNRWIMSWVKKMEACLPEALRPFRTLDSRTVLREVEPFIHYDIDPVLATFTARIRGFAASGVSGLCNLFVLNCMLGNVSVPIFRNALKTHQNLPVLHAVYDGQKQTNMLTRIEAFVHQAKLHQEHHAQSS
jgi:predicted nucleotide-binding protein (sugar kinase/HSP70/actin superfamily)